MIIARLILALMAWGFVAQAYAGSVQITDPLTGETFSYRPSFAPQEDARPTRRVYNTGEQKWVTQKMSRAELAERNRMRFARARVRFVSGEPVGTIVVDTTARHLYLVEGGGTAIRYGVGVGREGFTWSGEETVTKKADWPDWRPPAEMREREPWLPVFMPGGPDNPLGAAAIYLGNTLYRIHGTHQDHTIGYAVSSGCIRMLNEDVVDLAARVALGARVIVLGPQSDRSGLIAAISTL